MTIVVWLERVKVNGKETISPIEKKNLLEAVKFISLEQDRLTAIGAYKGSNELVNEAGRNFQE